MYRITNIAFGFSSPGGLESLEGSLEMGPFGLYESLKSQREVRYGLRDLVDGYLLTYETSSHLELFRGTSIVLVEESAHRRPEPEG